MTDARFVPGELDTLPGDIELNAGRPTVALTVANTGDRPIQVGSHYHFFETNDALQFDRPAAYGFRLDIPAGTAVRFEPGQSREVQLVALGGDRIVYGFAGRVMGPLGSGPSTGQVTKGAKGAKGARASRVPTPTESTKASKAKATKPSRSAPPPPPAPARRTSRTKPAPAARKSSKGSSR